jgi:hypothetical protein
MIALAVSASLAHAGEARLAWHDCRGDGGTVLKHFACDTNAGTQTLVGSFILDQPMGDYVGHEVIIDAQSGGTSLPAWWQFFNVGSCRRTALTVSFDFTPLANETCVDPFSTGSAPVGGIAAYCVVGANCVDAPIDASRVRIKIAGAMADPGALDSGMEWHGFRLLIANANTTGAGACAGCSTPVCLVLNSIKAAGLGGASELCVGEGQQNAGWQCGTSLAYGICDGSADCATPVRNPTWGQIKSLWR